ncbi:hypothetical protein Clacol_000553 [Clathrus columnatus]|uniref:Inosine/uridine-preferring nucleoside hydrolase domain-containing protein n=1 Tax=Clathrus columnatus TaxID=1419009 RepID=A0AAV4ZWU9_9AGAM|nr:hypothetical protein Clacol_000553 [Clathrus columnatus]
MTIYETELLVNDNILKLWYNLEKHFDKYQKNKERFPIFQFPYQNSDTPLLAKGSAEPLEGASLFAQYFHGRDGLSEITRRHPDLSPPPGWSTQYLRPTERSATEVTLDIICSHPPRTVTYVALGPLTNLARVLREDEEQRFGERIGRVIIMGGALDAPGNVTPAAECTVFQPFINMQRIIHEVLASANLPLERVFILPLDLTGSHILPFAEYKERVDTSFENTQRSSRPEEKTPLVHFTSAVLEMTREIMLGFGIDGMELHDPVAMWCAIANPQILEHDYNGNSGDDLKPKWNKRKRAFQVERYGEYTRGMLVVDRRMDESNYQPNENRQQVHTLHSMVANASVEMTSAQEILSGAIQGVNIITETPGSEELTRMIFQRIFGV